MSWNPFAAPRATTPEEDGIPDQPEASNTLSDRRAAAQQLRATTRSTSRTASTSTTSSGHLSAPTPSERIRAYSRSRSPTPTPSPTRSASSFDLTSAKMIDEETVKRITTEAVEFALRKDREERDRQQRIATEAAVSAALSNQTSQVRALRKPELPSLDKKNINSWLRRIEAAYARNDIISPKDKFAFLETKFNIDADAKINEFFEKDIHTEAHWTDFKAYLRDLFGRSRREEVYSIFNGVPRDGRRPKQFAAHIKDLVGKATLDDVLKELMLKEIPAEVRQHAATIIKSKNFQETADFLDTYFDKKGKVLDSTQASGINNISSLPSSMKPSNSRAEPPPPTRAVEDNSFTGAFADTEDASDVNAVRFQGGGRSQQSTRAQSRGRSRHRSGGNGSSANNRSQSRYSGPSNSNNNHRSDSRYSSNSNSTSGGGSSSSSSRTGNRSSSKTSNVCYYHEQYGQKARSCREGCLMWSQHQAAKGQANQ